MRALSAHYSIGEICQALGISRSGYYHACEREDRPSPRAQENKELLQSITHSYLENRRCYGSPRITKELQDQGIPCSENRVARLMAVAGIKAKKKKSFRPRTTIRAKEDLLAPNRLKDQPPPQGLNEVWVADITYIPVGDRWLYLAALMDLTSRKIVGWALEDHMKTSLIGKTLDQALACRLPAPGLLHHSDRGSQYTSRSFKERLKSSGLSPSMSQTGYCYDNAFMESFWSTLKTEVLPECGYFKNETHARRALFEYIEIFYNRKRRHSALGYCSPEDFENNLINNTKN